MNFLKIFSLIIIVLNLNCSAKAQDNYPQRAIKIIVPFTPGGVTDILARDISKYLNQRLGQPVIVENRGGANGNIGASMAAKSKPDGYTLLIAPANIAISAALYKNLNYDLFKDLQPITILATGPYILTVPAKSPANQLSQLIQMAKNKPGELAMASSGMGSAGHLAGELLQINSGVRLTHIPYKGQSDAMVDLIGGHAALFFATVAVVNPHLHDGKIKILAVTTKNRSPLLPQVPTISELGYPGFNIGAWHGLFVPNGVPKEIVTLLHQEITRYFTDVDIQKKYAVQGLQLVTNNPEDFTKFLRAEVLEYDRAIKKADIQEN